MGVPCTDDVMLNYQSTSFHDALAVRRLLGLRQAPEFARWWETQGWAISPAMIKEEGIIRERMLQQLDTVLEQAERII